MSSVDSMVKCVSMSRQAHDLETAWLQQVPSSSTPSPYCHLQHSASSSSSSSSSSTSSSSGNHRLLPSLHTCTNECEPAVSSTFLLQELKQQWLDPQFPDRQTILRQILSQAIVQAYSSSDLFDFFMEFWPQWLKHANASTQQINLFHTLFQNSFQQLQATYQTWQQSTQGQMNLQWSIAIQKAHLYYHQFQYLFRGFYLMSQPVWRQFHASNAAWKEREAALAEEAALVDMMTFTHVPDALNATSSSKLPLSSGSCCTIPVQVLNMELLPCQDLSPRRGNLSHFRPYLDLFSYLQKLSNSLSTSQKKSPPSSRGFLSVLLMECVIRDLPPQQGGGTWMEACEAWPPAVRDTWNQIQVALFRTFVSNALRPYLYDNLIQFHVLPLLPSMSTTTTMDGEWGGYSSASPMPYSIEKMKAENPHPCRSSVHVYVPTCPSVTSSSSTQPRKNLALPVGTRLIVPVFCESTAHQIRTRCFTHPDENVSDYLYTSLPLLPFASHSQHPKINTTEIQNRVHFQVQPSARLPNSIVARFVIGPCVVLHPTAPPPHPIVEPEPMYLYDLPTSQKRGVLRDWFSSSQNPTLGRLEFESPSLYTDFCRHIRSFYQARFVPSRHLHLFQSPFVTSSHLSSFSSSSPSSSTTTVSNSSLIEACATCQTKRRKRVYYRSRLVCHSRKQCSTNVTLQHSSSSSSSSSSSFTMESYDPIIDVLE